jgi:hypothetical protein
MKMYVRTSARVRIYPRMRKKPRPRERAWTRVARSRARADARSRGGGQILGFRVSTIKGGALPLFPHFQPSLVE